MVSTEPSEGLTPYPYDQIILLSQKTINDAFASMYKLADKKSPMHKLELDTRAGDYLHAVLGAPRIALQATTTDPQLFHHLTLKSGEIKIFRSDNTKDNTFDKFDTKDWILVFSVKLGRKQVKPSDPEYKEFKEKTGIKEENFSLAQLYVDTSTTTTWDKDHSTFGKDTEAVKALSARPRSRIDGFIQDWLNLMSESHYNILGYSVHVENKELDKYVSSFPATSIDYAVYPYSESSGGKDVKDDIDKNALCYLMMCEGHTPPTPPSLPYSDTFLKDVDARFCMSSQMIATWLAPTLQDACIAMTPTPGKGPAVDWVGGEFPWNVTLNIGMGFGHGSGYEVDTTKGPVTIDSEEEFAPPVEWLMGWRCSGPHDGVDKMTARKEHGSDAMYVKEEGKGISAYAGVGISKDSGSDGLPTLIRFGGRSHLVVRIDHEGPETWSEMNFEMTWHIDFRMLAVDKAGLGVEKIGASYNVEHASEGSLRWEEGLEAFAKDTDAEVKKALEDHSVQLEKSVTTGLMDQHRLFLPAAGTFVMKDPRFNKKGNLFVDLKYNGL